MSSNLGFPTLTPSQVGKTGTVNDMFSALDQILTEPLTVDLTAGNVTVSDADYKRFAAFVLANATVAGRIVTLPAIKRSSLVVSPAANTQTISLKVGTTTVVVSPGTIVVVYTDATANGLFVVSGSSSGSTSFPYDVAMTWPDVVPVSKKLIQHIAARIYTLPINLVGTQVFAGTPPSATTVLTVRKNTTAVATISIATTGIATIVAAAATVLAVGERLVVETPSVTNGLADLSITFAGVR